MLGDLFPPRRLGMATSVYYTGLPIGTALSLTIAGWVGPRFGWRACFYALGVIGLAAVGLLLVVREPPAAWHAERRRRAPDLVRARLSPTSSRRVRQRPALGLVMLGGAATGVRIGLGDARRDLARAGTRLHVRACGVRRRARWPCVRGLRATSPAAGYRTSAASAGAGGRAWSLALLAAGFAPFSAAFYLLPPASPLFYVCWFVSSASTVAYFGPVFAAVQELAPVAHPVERRGVWHCS